MENIRTFLEPNSDQPPPELDFTIHVDLSFHGGIIEDAVCAYYISLSDTADALVRNIFVTHFEQAVVGRNDKALTAAQEAVAIYTENAPHMWEIFLYTIRKQELGANAFYLASLRLAASAEPDQALIDAEKATELYRELVGLAPRHLSTLASSLQNLALTQWKVGRRDKAIAACEEAVRIMWNVAEPETCFLPALAKALDQLAGYFTEKGDVEGVSTAIAESAEDDEFPDVSELDAATDVEEVILEAAHTIISEPTTLCTTQISDTSTESQFESRRILVTVGVTVASNAAVIEAQVGVSHMDVTASIAAPDEGPTATDTDISIYPKRPRPFTDILRTPLEVRLNMRSTPADILWWVLTGILFALPHRQGTCTSPLACDPPTANLNLQDKVKLKARIPGSNSPVSSFASASSIPAGRSRAKDVNAAARLLCLPITSTERASTYAALVPAP
ncbi:hypothetical protein B0H19DRAFT_1247259 [Mycena capillaripes]|nr:hypothetical protein B0H19DRAFT_1247259 [Mycena capillaripes]